jgi:hypothetical protein
MKLKSLTSEDSKLNKIDKIQILKILEDNITALYNRPNRPENLEIELKRKKMRTRKALTFCKVKWKKLSRR